MRKIKEQGHDPAAAKRHARAEQDRRRENTFANVATRYMVLEAGMKLDDAGNAIKFDESKLRTGRERWLMLQRSILPTLGGMPITEIRRSDVVKLMDNLTVGDLKDRHGRRIAGGKVAADRALGVVRKIFRWHALRSDDFRSPIVPGMNRVKGREQARSRVLTNDELRVIWRTASQLEGPFSAFLKFCLLTGARRSEVAGLRWAEIDDAGNWELPPERNKTKLPLLRPLSAAARALLAAQPRMAGGRFVFTSDGRSKIGGFSGYKARFDAVVLCELHKENPEAEAFPNWTLHDLRRTARTLLRLLSRLSHAGVTSDHAERCLGHVIGGVRGVYDRREFYDEKKRAFEALARQITDIVEPPPTNVLPFPQAAAEGE
jgi:integrase